MQDTIVEWERRIGSEAAKVWWTAVEAFFAALPVAAVVGDGATPRAALAAAVVAAAAAALTKVKERVLAAARSRG